MQEPLISVIIPTYNRGNPLRDSVQSVLSQTYQNLELIVVDDCSTVPASCALVGITDPRLTIIWQPLNQGQAAARNAGAQCSRGQFLAFLDDDDLWKPAKLEHQLAYMRKEKADISITDFTMPENQLLYRRQTSKYDLKWMSFSGCIVALPSSILIKKDVFDRIGRFDTSPDLRRVEDWDFAIQIQRLGKNIVVVPEDLTIYTGIHKASPEAERNTLLSIQNKYKLALKGKDRKAMDAGLGWKMARIEIMAKHRVAGIYKLAATAVRHPINFMRYGKIVLERPISKLLHIESDASPSRVHPPASFSNRSKPLRHEVGFR